MNYFVKINHLISIESFSIKIERSEKQTNGGCSVADQKNQIEKDVIAFLEIHQKIKHYESEIERMEHELGDYRKRIYLDSSKAYVNDVLSYLREKKEEYKIKYNPEYSYLLFEVQAYLNNCFQDDMGELNIGRID